MTPPPSEGIRIEQPTSVVIPPPAAPPEIGTPSGGSTPIGQYQISGTIALEYGLAASKLKIRVYDRGFGGRKTLLAETATDDGGLYSATYTAKGVPTIEIYAVGSDGMETQLSKAKVGASARNSSTSSRPLLCSQP